MQQFALHDHVRSALAVGEPGSPVYRTSQSSEGPGSPRTTSPRRSFSPRKTSSPQRGLQGEASAPVLGALQHVHERPSTASGHRSSGGARTSRSPTRAYAVNRALPPSLGVFAVRNLSSRLGSSSGPGSPTTADRMTAAAQVEAAVQHTLEASIKLRVPSPVQELEQVPSQSQLTIVNLDPSDEHMADARAASPGLGLPGAILQVVQEPPMRRSIAGTAWVSATDPVSTTEGAEAALAQRAPSPLSMPAPGIDPQYSDVEEQEEEQARPAPEQANDKISFLRQLSHTETPANEVLRPMHGASQPHPAPVPHTRTPSPQPQAGPRIPSPHPDPSTQALAGTNTPPAASAPASEHVPDPTADSPMVSLASKAHVHAKAPQGGLMSSPPKTPDLFSMQGSGEVEPWSQDASAWPLLHKPAEAGPQVNSPRSSTKAKNQDSPPTTPRHKAASRSKSPTRVSHPAATVTAARPHTAREGMSLTALAPGLTARRSLSLQHASNPVRTEATGSAQLTSPVVHLAQQQVPATDSRQIVTSPSSPKLQQLPVDAPTHRPSHERGVLGSPASPPYQQQTIHSRLGPRPGSALPRPSTAPQPDLGTSTLPGGFKAQAALRPSSAVPRHMPAVSRARSPGGARPRSPAHPYVPVPAPEPPPTPGSELEAESSQPAITGHSLLKPRADASAVMYASTLEAVEHALFTLRQRQGAPTMLPNVQAGLPPSMQRPNTYDRVLLFGAAADIEVAAPAQPDPQQPASTKPSSDGGAGAPASPAALLTTVTSTGPVNKPRRFAVHTLLDAVEDEEADAAMRTMHEQWLTPDDARQALLSPPARGSPWQVPALRSSTAPASLGQGGLNKRPLHPTQLHGAAHTHLYASSLGGRPGTVPASGHAGQLRHSQQVRLQQQPPELLYVDLHTSMVTVRRPKADSPKPASVQQHGHAAPALSVDKFRAIHRPSARLRSTPPRPSTQPVLCEEAAHEMAAELSLPHGVVPVPGGHTSTSHSGSSNAAELPADLSTALSSSVLGLPGWAANLPAPPQVPVACRTMLSTKVHTDFGRKYDKWRQDLKSPPALTGSQHMQPVSAIMDTIEVTVGASSMATARGSVLNRPSSPLVHVTSKRPSTSQGSITVEKGVTRTNKGQLIKGTAGLRAVSGPPAEGPSHVMTTVPRGLTSQGLKLLVAHTVPNTYMSGAAPRPSEGGSSVSSGTSVNDRCGADAGANQLSAVRASMALPTMHSKLAKDMQYATTGTLPISMFQTGRIG